MSVGSPALVAYSLILTSLNARSVYQRAKGVKHEDKTLVARALISLQQTPLELTKHGYLLAFITTDSRWAQEVVGRLYRRNVWSIATTVCIAWVVVVSFLALVPSFLSDSDGSPEGHAIAALWSWLLCLVIGWFWVPTFTSVEIKATLRHVNQKAAKRAIKGLRQAEMRSTEIELSNRLPARMGRSEKPVGTVPRPPEVNEEEKERAFQVDEKQAGRKIDRDTNPLPNSSHLQSVLPSRLEEDHDHPDPSVNPIQGAISGADYSTRGPINPENDELLVHQSSDPLNRDAFRHAATFNYSRVMRYLLLVDDVFTALDRPAHEATAQHQRTVVFPQKALISMFIASILALVLQCGTTAAATIIAAFTPTIGVGCHSLGYMLYGGFAIVIMFLTIASTILSRISETRAMTSIIKGFTASLAIALHRLSLSLAFMNAVGLVLLPSFQFSGYLDDCYCGASVIGRGTNSYVIFPYSGWLNDTRIYRILSTVISTVSMAFYMAFLWSRSTLPRNVDDI